MATKKPSDKKSEEKTEEKSSSPIHKAFYVEKVNGLWRFVIADIQDDKILDRVIKEDQNKALSLERFRIEFAKMYYFGK